MENENPIVGTEPTLRQKRLATFSNILKETKPRVYGSLTPEGLDSLVNQSPEHKSLVFFDLKGAGIQDFAQDEDQFDKLLQGLPKDQVYGRAGAPVSQPSETPVQTQVATEQPAIEQPVLEQPVTENQPQEAVVDPLAEEPTRPIPQQQGEIEAPYLPPAGQMAAGFATNPVFQGLAKAWSGLKEAVGVKPEKVNIRYNDLSRYEQHQKAFVQADKANQDYEVAVRNHAEKMKGAAKVMGLSPEELAKADSPKNPEWESDYAGYKQRAQTALENAQPKVDEVVDKIYGQIKGKAFTKGVNTGKPIVNMGEVEKQARKAAKAEGAPETGYLYSLVKNKLKAKLEFEQVKPSIDSEFTKVYKELYKSSPETDQQKEFAKTLSGVDKIKTQAELQVKNLGTEISSEAATKAKELASAYKKEADAINAQTIEVQKRVNAGEITPAEANAELKAQHGQAFASYMKGLNVLNSKYNARYRRQAEETVALANAEINKQVEQKKATFKISPEMEAKLKKAYGTAYQRVMERKDLKDFQRDKNASLINNFVNTYISSFGAGIKGAATTMKMPNLAAMGDLVENEFSPSRGDMDGVKDLLDPTKFTMSFGNLMGRMTPGLVTSAGVAAATQGMGLPTIPSLLLSGFAGAGSESLDIVGTMYNEVLAQTGDANKARTAALKSFQSQLVLLPTYALDGLPFFSKVLKGIKNVPLRALAGAGIEFGTEMTQEVPQNAYEQLIKDGGALSDVTKELTWERTGKTALQLAPVMLLGGAPHLFGGSREVFEKHFAERAAKAYMAKGILAANLEDQNQSQFLFQIANERGSTFAKALLGTLYANGKITDQQNENLGNFLENTEKFLQQQKQVQSQNGGREYAPKQEEAKIAALLFNNLEEAKKSGDAQAIGQAQAEYDAFTKTGRANILSVELSDGSRYHYNFGEFSRMLENPGFQDLVRNGDVKLGTYADRDANPEMAFIDEKIHRMHQGDGNVTPENAPVEPKEVPVPTPGTPLTPEESDALPADKKWKKFHGEDSLLADLDLKPGDRVINNANGITFAVTQTEETDDDGNPVYELIAPDGTVSRTTDLPRFQKVEVTNQTGNETETPTGDTSGSSNTEGDGAKPPGGGDVTSTSEPGATGVFSPKQRTEIRDATPFSPLGWARKYFLDGGKVQTTSASKETTGLRKGRSSSDVLTGLIGHHNNKPGTPTVDRIAEIISEAAAESGQDINDQELRQAVIEVISEGKGSWYAAQAKEVFPETEFTPEGFELDFYFPKIDRPQPPVKIFPELTADENAQLNQFVTERIEGGIDTDGTIALAKLEGDAARAAMDEVLGEELAAKVADMGLEAIQVESEKPETKKPETNKDPIGFFFEKNRNASFGGRVDSSVTDGQFGHIQQQLNQLEKKAAAAGTVFLNEGWSNRIYEKVDGKEQALNVFKADGYTITYQSPKSHDGRAFVSIVNPTGEELQIQDQRYKAERSRETFYFKGPIEPFSIPDDNKEEKPKPPPPPKPPNNPPPKPPPVDDKKDETPPPADTKKEKKKTQRKERDAAVDAEAQKLVDEINAAIRESMGTATSGVSPKVLAPAISLVALKTKQGVLKFSDLVEDLADMGVEISKEFLRALKYAYNGYRGDPETPKDMRKQMSSEDDVLDYEYTAEEGEEGSEEEEETPPTDKKELTANELAFVQVVKEEISEGTKLTLPDLRKLLPNTEDTDLQELVELAVVQLAREVSNNEEMDASEKWEVIQEIYKAQPSITMRSSDKVAKQQYSTPIPMAYAMSDFLATANPVRTLEPSAGNGALVVTLNPENVVVNEIDRSRLANLEVQGFGQVLSQDGTKPFKGQFDSVATNPPFGSADEVIVDGYKIKGLDPQMIINALNSMADYGTAAIIMGGHNEYDEVNKLKSNRTFFNYLYSHYNVLDVINVAGSLYYKQGTSFPTRIILISGRKATAEGAAPLKTEKLSSVVTDFKELKQRIDDAKAGVLQSEMDAGSNDGGSDDGGTDGSGGGSGSNAGGSGTGSGRKGGRSGRGGGGGRSGRSGNGRGSSSSGSGGSTSSESGTGDSESSSSDGSVSDDDSEISDTNDGTDGAGDTDTGGGESDLSGNNADGDAGAVIDIESEKTEYLAFSKGPKGGTVQPTAMAQETRKVMADLVAKYGDVDTFVTKELGYKNKEELYKALNAEQIDAVALSIAQYNNDSGMIIGDMTGVGKGRIAAAMLRFANLKGHKPIFLSIDPALFSDMYRDLKAIGSGHLKPFIFNEDAKANVVEFDDEGEPKIIYRHAKKEDRNLAYSTGELPPGYDFAMTTYSQLNPEKETNKKSLFRQLAVGNVMVLDESHSAAGTSNTGRFIGSAVASSRSPIFLSATFAKRPENMPLYSSKTAMADSGVTGEAMAEAIARGGVALQEILSAQLVEAGQMVRRERPFEDVEMTFSTMGENDNSITQDQRKKADAVISLFRDIIAFQNQFIKPIIRRLNEEAAEAGEGASEREGTQNMGVSNTEFASRIFNAVNQLLFSLKAEEVANEVIRELKAGRKPVVGFQSTMGSFLASLGLSEGDVVKNTDFSQTLVRGLEGTLRYTRRLANGESVLDLITPEQLGAEGTAILRKLREKIQNNVSGIPLSPIDTMIKKIEEAGYKVGEITGRDERIVYHDRGEPFMAKRGERDKKKTVAGFNNGTIDVILFNQSGATGISMHASETFKDQRQRVMIMAQAPLDVNTFIQMMGRIDRTGQVVRGAYKMIASAIPAEKRFQMMLAKKVASLFANSSGRQKTSSVKLDVVDFANKYGDEIMTRYLIEHPAINEKLQDPLKLRGMSQESLAALEKVDGAADMALRKAALLLTQEQDEFYDEITNQYKAVLEYLNSNNANDLEVTVLPLKAKTLASTVLIAGSGVDNPFGKDTMLEEVEVAVLKKPLKIAQIDERIKDGLDGKTSEDAQTEMIEGARDYYSARMSSEDARIRERMQERVASAFDDIDADTSIDEEYGEAADQVRESMKESARALHTEEMEAAIEQSDMDLTRRKNLVVNALNRLIIGKVYKVPIDTQPESATPTVNGILTGIKIDHKAKNPFAPSNITLSFATQDSRQFIKVPLSKTVFIDQLIHKSYVGGHGNIQQFRDNWDQRQAEMKNREKRYVVTGNILPAMTQPGLRGNIIAYSTDEGKIKKGIFLPRDFSAASIRSRVRIADALPLIDRAGAAGITAIGEEIILRGDGNEYILSVPSSRTTGGKYYLNDKVLELVAGQNFRQQGARFMGRISRENIQPMLEVLGAEFGMFVESVPLDFQGNTEVETNIGKPQNNNRAQQEKVIRTSLAVIGRLNSMMGTTAQIITDPVEIDRIKALPGFQHNIIIGKGNDVLGFIYNGDVYVDPRVATEKTAIHEAGHIWLNWLEQTNPLMFQQGIGLVAKETKYLREAGKITASTNPMQIKKEALAMAIADAGMNAANPKTMKSFLNRIYEKIGQFFGIRLTAQEISDLTFKEFVNSAAYAIVNGSPTLLDETDPVIQRYRENQQKRVLKGVDMNKFSEKLKVMGTYLSGIWKAHPHLKGKTFGEIKNLLGQLKRSLAASIVAAKVQVASVYEGLTQDEMDVLGLYVNALSILNDIQAGYHNDIPGDVDIAFGLNKNNIWGWIDQMEEKINANARLKGAFEMRKQIFDRLYERAVDLDMLPEKDMDKNHYFRRLRLDLIEAKYKSTMLGAIKSFFKGGPSPLSTKKSRTGTFQKRTVFRGDFYTDAKEVDMDAIVKMNLGLSVREIINEIKQIYQPEVLKARKEAEAEVSQQYYNQTGKIPKAIATRVSNASKSAVDAMMRNLPDNVVDITDLGDVQRLESQGRMVATDAAKKFAREFLASVGSTATTFGPIEKSRYGDLQNSFYLDAYAVIREIGMKNITDSNQKDNLANALKGSVKRFFNKHIEAEVQKEFEARMEEIGYKAYYPEGYSRMVGSFLNGNLAFDDSSAEVQSLMNQFNIDADEAFEAYKKGATDKGVEIMWAPAEVVDTLLDLTPTQGKFGPVSNLIKQAVRASKTFQLLNPGNVVNYLWQNLSGNSIRFAELGGNKNYLKRGLDTYFNMAPEDRAWYVQRGIVNSGDLSNQYKPGETGFTTVDRSLVEAAIADIQAATNTKELLAAYTKLLAARGINIPLDATSKYIRFMMMADNFLTDIYRLGIYHKAMDMLSEGTVPNMGANLYDLQGIESNRDKAAYAALKAFGDYAAASKLASYMADYGIMPFIRYMNTAVFQFYGQRLQNVYRRAAIDTEAGKPAEEVAKKALAEIAVVMSGLLATTIIQQLITNLVFDDDDEEKKLLSDKGGDGIPLGIKDKNNENYMVRLGAPSNDMLRMTGIIAAYNHAMAGAGGQTAQQTLSDVIDETYSMVGPIVKIPYSLGTQTNHLYNIGGDMPVYDNMELIMKGLPGNQLTRSAMGKVASAFGEDDVEPQESILDQLSQSTMVKKTHATIQIQNRVRELLQDKNLMKALQPPAGTDQQKDFFSSQRNLYKSIQQENFDEFMPRLKNYADKGGDLGGFEDYVDRKNPFSRVSVDNQDALLQFAAGGNGLIQYSHGDPKLASDIFTEEDRKLLRTSFLLWAKDNAGFQKKFQKAMSGATK